MIVAKHPFRTANPPPKIEPFNFKMSPFNFEMSPFNF